MDWASLHVHVSNVVEKFKSWSNFEVSGELTIEGGEMNR